MKKHLNLSAKIVIIDLIIVYLHKLLIMFIKISFMRLTNGYKIPQIGLGTWRTLMKVWLLTVVLGLQACSDNDDNPVEVDVRTISEEMAAVRDYVPLYAVIAHRGSTYWAPEETESAWRWAREMGADYLESDLQCSKDGIIIANHDDTRKYSVRRFLRRVSRSMRVWDSRTRMLWSSINATRILSDLITCSRIIMQSC